MALDRRRAVPGPRTGTSLPHDFLTMVRDVFANHFGQPKLEARGEIHSDEILLAITLRGETGIAATTVYASVDYDPKASSPTAPDLLGCCVDAAGELIERVLAAREGDVPPRLWTPTEQDGRPVFVRADSANPELDEAADAWLDRHDPDRRDHREREEKERAKVIRTGPRSEEELNRALGGVTDDDDGDEGPSSATH